VGDPRSLFDAPKVAEAPASITTVRAKPATSPAIMPVASDLPVPEAPTPIAVPSNAAPSGEHFMDWLRQRIRERKLIINNAKVLVRTVDGTACLVSLGVFQHYAQGHLKVASLAKQDGIAN
jgi:hypothetical protein